MKCMTVPRVVSFDGKNPDLGVTLSSGFYVEGLIFRFADSLSSEVLG